MLTSHIMKEFVLFGSASFAWWFMAPVVARVPDTRMPERNPNHFARVVAFHRAWGLAAIMLGAIAALAC